MRIRRLNQQHNSQQFRGGKPMDDKALSRITADPNYQKLVADRGFLSKLLSILIIIVYFGFILLVAFAPSLLSTSLTGGVTTVGIVVGLSVIVCAFVLTGIYVARANGAFDTLTQKIVQEAKR
jgi:uncharacterized membrane protein (DUF485 family)